MNRIRLSTLVLAALTGVGCTSSQTPQATSEVAKQFSGGPMPPDAQKKFEESMKKNKQPGPPNGQPAGGKP